MKTINALYARSKKSQELLFKENSRRVSRPVNYEVSKAQDYSEVSFIVSPFRCELGCVSTSVYLYCGNSLVNLTKLP